MPSWRRSPATSGQGLLDGHGSRVRTRAPGLWPLRRPARRAVPQPGPNQSWAAGAERPYTYECARRTDTGGWAGCQSPGGPYIDRAVTALVLFALETLELNGIEAAFADRRRQTDETARQRAAQMSALERRATMLEAAISEAQTSEARARLVVRFDGS